MEYIFNVAEALGCTHTTLELPTDPKQLKRIGDMAVKKKIYASYHTHLQGSMTAFDEAFALSKGNTANIDIGHYVAAGNPGGSPLEFFETHHARITSFHLKDRTTPKNCALNLPFGEGETPIKEILHLLRTRQWKIPATIELEYQIPRGLRRREGSPQEPRLLPGGAQRPHLIVVANHSRHPPARVRSLARRWPRSIQPSLARSSSAARARLLLPSRPSATMRAPPQIPKVRP